MPKFFVTSDIHSFYTELIDALNQAGFDENNEEHWLIVCGDCFDRGPDSAKVLKYLQNLPRKVLVKGNHEQLLVDCCERGWPMSHDVSNGTMRTISHLGYGDELEDMCKYTLIKIRPFLDGMVNYFETKNYIFVHSWIPTIHKYEWPEHHTYSFEFDPNWRQASQTEWNNAMWGNPFEKSFEGLNQTGKTIVFGHWHCSAGHRMLGHCNDEFDGYAIWEPCYADGIIGIDRCTAYTGETNVIVLEDEFLEN